MCDDEDLYEGNLEFGRGATRSPAWESFEAQQAWKDSAEFRERIARVRQHTDDFTPSVFELVTAVE